MKMLRTALRHPLIAMKGALEFRSGLGATYGDGRDEAYDFGRDLAHRITFRKWDHDAWDYCYSPKCERDTIWNGEFCSSCGREWGYPL